MLFTTLTCLDKGPFPRMSISWSAFLTALKSSPHSFKDNTLFGYSTADDESAQLCIESVCGLASEARRKLAVKRTWSWMIRKVGSFGVEWGANLWFSTISTYFLKLARNWFRGSSNEISSFDFIKERVSLGVISSSIFFALGLFWMVPSTNAVSAS